MQTTHYVYGVYKQEDAFLKAYERIIESGLSDIYVLKNGDADLKNFPVSIKHPVAELMLRGAAYGAMLGAFSSLLQNFRNITELQVLTPIMLCVCGAALGAYMGLFISFALNGLEHNQVKPEVYDAEIPGECFVLGAAVCDQMQKQIAVDCISDDQMIELVVRNQKLNLPVADVRVKEELQLVA